MKLESLPLRPDPLEEVDCWVVFCRGSRVFFISRSFSKGDARSLVRKRYNGSIIYIGKGRCPSDDLLWV
jgi:hypothetical protein